MNSPLINFYNLNQTEVSAAVILFNLIFAFILGSIIVWLWRKTHKGLSYSQSYAFTILMLCPLAATVMMIVQNNLVGAFALLGAFSLIRFRTIIKETRDVAFLFFSLTAGVASGTSNYAVAIISTFLITVVIWWLYKYDFGTGEKTGYVLTIETQDTFSPESLQGLFDQYLKYYELLHAKRSVSVSEYAYSILFKKPEDAIRIMDGLRAIPTISHSYLITGKELIEY